jgi:hypothetical protein
VLLMAKKKPKKPARDLTNEEAAEWVFGKRVVRRVRKELEDEQTTEKPRKSLKKSATKSKGK